MMGIPGTITELHAWLNTMVTDTDRSEGTLVMLCGMAGSGKTTAAKFLEARGFVRLSIDEEIWHRFGRFGIDYPAETYPSLQQRAASDLWSRLPALLGQAVPMVITAFGIVRHATATSVWQSPTQGDGFCSI
jgi:hypothetical protein